ncbi:MAG: hypothetical protein ACK5RO_01950 [Pseudobdellovibrionaceae bacterium]
MAIKGLVAQQHPLVLLAIAAVGIPAGMFILFMAGVFLICIGSLLVQAEFWQLLGAWLWSLI